MTGATGEHGTRPSGVDAAAALERLLALVLERSRDAQASGVVRTGVSALTRFANSAIHQNVAEEVNSATLEVALDGRVASGGFDGPFGNEPLRRLVDVVFAAAATRPPDPDWAGVAPSAVAPSVDHWDAETAATPPDERARRVSAFVTAAGGLETAGFCSTEARLIAFANTAGQWLTGRSTLATVDGIARTGSSDGSARHSAVALAAIDADAVGALAARRARESADPGDLEPGRYEVVLSPACVADVTSFLFRYGFNGRAVEEGRSFVRLGERQFDPAIKLREDVTDPRQAGIAFDAEGTPRRRVDVVRSGVTGAVLHTRRTGLRAGAPSTGSRVAGAETWGAVATNVVLDEGDRSLDDLVGGMERGLLVTDFWYTRIVDPRTQVVTGLTRNGVWLVEHGRVARPVRNLRFTQSYLDALAPGAVLGVGKAQALVTDGLDGASLVPPLRLAGWNFTGGARG